MRWILLSLLFSCITVFSLGQQEQMSYKSRFETQDTSFHIKLRMVERHGLWKMQCYQNRNSHVNTRYVSSEVRDSLQRFFISKIDGVVDPKIIERLHFSVIEVFNENKTVDSFTNLMDTPRCNRIHYEFQSLFMFDDSLWFPLHIYLNNEGGLLHQSSILETLGSLETFEIPSRIELFDEMYKHRKFREHSVDSEFNMYYSEARKRFYYEFVATSGKEIERTSNSVKTKVNHVFVDVFTGKILWKPTFIHEDGWGSCTIWTRIQMSKNKLIGQW
ncbi:MAG: hypothetical protein AB8B56_07395 [Crocinitomicaceae bacterium]